MKSLPSSELNFPLKNILLSLSIVGLTLFNTACEDFIKIDPPRTDLVKNTVFGNDETAKAAVLDIYYQLRTSGFANGTARSISFYGSMYSDEEINYYKSSPEITADVKQFNDNTLSATNSYLLYLWTDLYKCIYKTNAVLEGLATNTGTSEDLRKQLEGESKFIRAFCHFYLVNLWGDIPLVLTTDYQINSRISRTPEPDVYKQIIKDLIDSQSLLSEDYSFSNNEKVCANKGVATALLARVYLFAEEWGNAETQATAVIGNIQYELASNLADVFNVNSKEALLQIWHDYIPNDLFTFDIFSFGPSYGALRPEFAGDFEAGDQRWVIWGSSRVVNGKTYYYPIKYYSFDFAPPAQYSTVLRLAEQYLIRAEARAQQGNIGGAIADTNVIRHRAGLGDTPANDKASILLAIEHERKSELFTEWGHRWLDLKRTHRADAVLSLIKPGWASSKVLFPIPEYELKNNLGLKDAQNPGY